MAQRAVGTKFKIGTNFVAELSSIGGLELSADTIDVTTLDSDGGYRKFIGGFKDAGEVSLSGFFAPGDSGQAAIYAAFESGTVDNYSIIFPAGLGAQWDFQGVVTKFTTSAATEDAVPFEATIKVSGKPTLGLTPSAGLTALSITATGGTLAPAFAAGKYVYAMTGITGATATITATAANHTLSVYVDGVYNQVLSSGVASSNITLPASGTGSQFTVFAQEDGKTVKTYEISMIRA